MEKEKQFSVQKRAKSFTHAGRGLVLYIKTTHNAWIHIVLFACALLLGYFFAITNTEWMMLIIVSGFVFTAEAFNSAIEIDMDLTSPEYHPAARDTKDIAAGAVLISALTALIVGGLVFVPHLITLLK